MQGQNGQASGQRKLHIAHRRSPSEMTPLMVEQLALAQQIEFLQQQQQQIAATHQQYVNMGVIPPQQQLPNLNVQVQPTYTQSQIPPTYTQVSGHLSPPQEQGQFGNQRQQQFQNNTHRRNQSAVVPGIMGPPPAPSAGSAGNAFGDFSFPAQVENNNPNNRGGQGGHARRHSLALPEAKRAAELAEAKRKSSGFQFPVPGASGVSPSGPIRSASPNSAAESSAPPAAQSTPRNNSTASRNVTHGRSQSMAIGNPRGGNRGGPPSFQFPVPAATGEAAQPDTGRRSSQNQNQYHGRSQSRNFDNWRTPQPTINEPLIQGQSYQGGHRSRTSIGHQSMSSIGSLGGMGLIGQPQIIQTPQGQMLIQPNMLQGQQLSQLQFAQLQAYQAAGLQAPMMGSNGGQMSVQQQQQQRKTLFTPYLPQATLPALLSDGQLVAGILRVNKKNRSDAYVTTTDLDADIFICGSKDRNRALEGDLVAVELLDVDEVWGQKREKEEKKKRKDLTDTRNGSITAVNDATTQPESSAAEGGIRRRGSLKQRPVQKKNDDVEVEGQSLLLTEEDEINDEQKPLYAGHIVAVVERIAAQMFSGTLGLLRPSSQATKERQEAERGGRQQERHQPERPKIVWFKPTDKRVPLIAIPTEQAPKDFVDKHADYANKIFVASIKRWPITSLHPFGTLVEQLGDAGDLRVETDALLRDNNFGPDEFSEAVAKSVGFDEWSVENDGESALEGRRDLRNETTYTIDPNGSNELDDAIHHKILDNGRIELGMHVTDVAHFVKPASLVDREAKKRGTGVYLMNRTVDMLPAKLAADVCCLGPGQDRYTVSVIVQINAETGQIYEEDTWIGKSVIKSSGKLAYSDVDAVIGGATDSALKPEQIEKIKSLHSITRKMRQARFDYGTEAVSTLRLLYQLDDENVPVERNIFHSSPAHEMIEEISHKANSIVARKIHAGLPEKAFLRRHAPPNPRRLQMFTDRMRNIGFEVDISSSKALQSTLFKIHDLDVRKGMETLLVKALQRAKYFVASKVPDDQHEHYALDLPLYTHFTNPSRRYADIIVHRQLEHVLTDGAVEFTEDVESLAKVAESCNTKKDSAHSAQEQSMHIESCRTMEQQSRDIGRDLVSEGIVVCVYESAFDVLVPEYGFEKRVHCDQLPLKKAEFDKDKRLLELYWEKGVPTSNFVPEDERSGSGYRAADKEAVTEAKLQDKKRYSELFKTRESNGNCIQDVQEMIRIPVILKTDMTKSPPCLTIRSINPFAL